jgi:hypothetical protein
MLDLQPRVDLHQVELVRRRRGTRRCPHRRTPPSARAARRRRPCARAAPRPPPGWAISSTSFWWRRCTEQSRSPRWMQRPCASARTCTSTWRGAASARSSRSSRCRRPLAPASARWRARRAGPRHAPRRACRGRRRRPRP